VLRLIWSIALPFNLLCILGTSLTVRETKRERTREIKNWICFAWEQEEGEINGATKHSVVGEGELLYVAVRGWFQMFRFLCF
jgi:hypothetical protein